MERRLLRERGRKRKIEINRDREIERDREIARDREIERNREIERDREGEREREREQKREREREGKGVNLKQKREILRKRNGLTREKLSLRAEEGSCANDSCFILIKAISC